MHHAWFVDAVIELNTHLLLFAFDLFVKKMKGYYSSKIIVYLIGDSGVILFSFIKT